MSNTASATEGCQHEWEITHPYEGGDSRTDRPAVSVCKKCGKKERGVKINVYEGDLNKIFHDLMLYDILRTGYCKDFKHDRLADLLMKDFSVDIKDVESPGDYDEQGNNTAGRE